MNIVIDARESGTSTGRYVDKLVDNLQLIDTHNRYTLLYLPGRINNVSITNPNFVKKVLKYKKFGLRDQLAEQFITPFVLNRLKPDLVHFPLAQHPLLYFGKTVISMLDLTPLYFKNPATNPAVYFAKQRLYWLMNVVAAKKTSHIIAISNFVKNQITRTFHVDPHKVTTTYCASDKITDDPEPLKALQGKKFIMYVGRHMPHKNLLRLIEAHQLLLKKHPETILVIAGKIDKTTALLKTQKSKLKTQNLLFTGFASEGELRWLYENCVAYVFPSLSEGFGLPGLEAMQHGAPVISSNATCLPEIYGDAALYFDPLDVQDMANKIDNMLSNLEVGDNLKNKGHQKANEYSWHRMAEQTLAIYTKALSKQ
jgi:glycosyltransferase involved in cell wall biosynthesis